MNLPVIAALFHEGCQHLLGQIVEVRPNLFGGEASGGHPVHDHVLVHGAGDVVNADAYEIVCGFASDVDAVSWHLVEHDHYVEFRQVD